MKKKGRPLKVIEKKYFEYLCNIMATEEEIAGLFECHVDTINNWCKREYGETFSEVYKKKTANGRISLRRLQYKSAEDGNVTMQIWLGKQWLGQTDKMEAEVVNKITDETRQEIEDFLNDDERKEEEVTNKDKK